MAGGEWLRGKATAAGGLLWGFVQAFWPQFTGAAILSAATAFFSGAVAWVQKANVYIPALVFGYFFVIISLVRYRWIRSVPDYDYGISSDGNFQAMLAKAPGKKPGDPERDGVFFAVGFRSASNAPLRLKVEVFQVVLDERTHAANPELHEVVVPRFAPRGIRSAFVPRDPTQTQLSGDVTIQLLYGPVNRKETRRYTLKFHVNIGIAETPFGPQANMTNCQTSETDTEIHVEG